MSVTLAQFRAQHGDYDSWSSADYDTYEILAEAADPGIATAIAAGLQIVGRHADGGGQVVIDLHSKTTPAATAICGTALAS